MAIQAAVVAPSGVDKHIGSASRITPRPEQVRPSPQVVINREPVISSQELDVKIAQLNDAMVSSNQAVVFSRDSATGKDVVRVNNKSTGELIRQMPNDEALKAAQSIDQMIGLIFNQST